MLTHMQWLIAAVLLLLAGVALVFVIPSFGPAYIWQGVVGSVALLLSVISVIWWVCSRSSVRQSDVVDDEVPPPQ